jgi:hypothetical protein
MLGVAACATVPAGGALSGDTPTEAKTAAVTKRALDRWDALLKGDTKTAYGYLSPASRDVTPLERYQSRVNRSIREAKVTGVTCEAEVCKASVVVKFDHRLAKGLEAPLTETWVISDGQAWLVYRE